jgi:hypothetical protein
MITSASSPFFCFFLYSPAQRPNCDKLSPSRIVVTFLQSHRHIHPSPASLHRSSIRHTTCHSAHASDLRHVWLIFISNITPGVSYYPTQAGSNQLVKPVDPAEAWIHGHQAAHDAAAAERTDGVRDMLHGGVLPFQLQRGVLPFFCKVPAELFMGFTGTMRSKAAAMLLSQNSMALS